MQPFVQADSSTTRQYGGTGLGLAISKRLVTEMRGELTISSVFGKGSTFSFNAHFGRGTPTETSRTVSDVSDEALAAALVWLGRASLLVVDDNTFNQQVAAETLESAGAAVTVASNGREALACLASAHFDIVFMDLQMPVMDGYEATRHIRATPALADQCVIAMTANAMTGDRDRCIEGGMDDFISKPIEPAQLYIVIHKWLVRCMAPDRNQARTDQPADAATQPTPAPSTTHSQPSDQMPIDLAVLRNLLKNDPVKVALFASKFAETARTILAEMHSASERQDLSGLSALAHKLKSSAATVGALGMASTCNNLESAGHDSNWPGARACLTVLTEIVQHATKQVEDSAS
jgi:CheY-like chemotaxis protein